MEKKCVTCEVHKEELELGGVCIWYMDNVFCGGKSTSECPMYHPMISPVNSSTTRYNNSDIINTNEKE